MDIISRFLDSSFYSDSLNRVLFGSFTSAKVKDVAIRAVSLYLAGAIFQSSLAFDIVSVVGANASRISFNHLNILKQPLDTIFLNFVDDTLMFGTHYAVVFTLHYGVRMTSNIALEFVEFWHSNSTLMLTGFMGIISFFLFVKNPWEKVAVAFREFDKVDNKVNEWRARVIGSALAWIVAALKFLILAAISLIGVAYVSLRDVLGLVVSWIPWYTPALAHERFPPSVSAAFTNFRDLDAIAKTRLREIALEIQKVAGFHLWRLRQFAFIRLRGYSHLDQEIPMALITSDLSHITDPHEHKYQGLQSPQEIRLLKVLQTRGAMIRCELVSFRLQDAPKYDCISYTWGDASPNHLILVDGCLYRTSKTVYSILEAQKFRLRESFIWIDSVCINQADDAEKSTQVAMMRDIYRTAKEVLVWLGDFDEAPRAIALLAELKDQIRKYGATAKEIYMHYIQNSRTKDWSSLIKLLKLPWFHRVWVVQEVAQAQRLRVLVGGKFFDWENFLSVIQAFSDPALALLLQEDADFSDSHSAIDGMRHALQMAHFRRIAQRKTLLTLTSYLEMTIGFKSTDPRDRVYALLGLVNQDLGLVPDYKNTVEHVYCDIARLLVTNFGEPFFILSFAGTGYGRNLTKMPSWVPDWSVTRNGQPTLGHTGNNPGKTIYYHAGDAAQFQVYLRAARSNLSPRSMHLSGAFVDIIVYIGQVPDEITTVWDAKSNPWLDYLHKRLIIHRDAQRIARLNQSDVYPTGCSSHEAFWRTLIGDTVGQTRPAPLEYGLHCEEWERMTQDAIDAWARGAIALGRFIKEGIDVEFEPPLLFKADKDADRKRCHNYASWTTAAARYSYSRRFCVTSEGYFGLFPPGTRLGDQVWVILGAQTPFLCRSLGFPNAWELVGECYVHGIMDGEVLRRNEEIEHLTLY